MATFFGKQYQNDNPAGTPVYRLSTTMFDPTDYALTSDLPDLSPYALLTDIPDVPEGGGRVVIISSSTLSSNTWYNLSQFSIPNDVDTLILYGISSSSSWTNSSWSYATAHNSNGTYSTREGSRVHMQSGQNSNTPVGSQTLIPVITNNSNNRGFRVTTSNYTLYLHGYLAA